MMEQCNIVQHGIVQYNENLFIYFGLMTKIEQFVEVKRLEYVARQNTVPQKQQIQICYGEQIHVGASNSYLLMCYYFCLNFQADSIVCIFIVFIYLHWSNIRERPQLVPKRSSQSTVRKLYFLLVDKFTIHQQFLSQGKHDRHGKNVYIFFVYASRLQIITMI